MKCPVCGSDRVPKDEKCGACGVIYASWVKKIVARLEMTKRKVVDGTEPKRIGGTTEGSSDSKYKESFDLNDI